MKLWPITTKVGITAVGATLIAAAVTGCSGDGGSTPTAEKAGELQQAVKTVKVVLPIGVSGEEEFYKEQLKQFMQRHADIKVDLQFVPTDQYGNTISLMFASNEAPDIIRMSGSLPTKMSISYEKGWIQPLDAFVTDSFKQRFPSTFFTPHSGLYLDGKLYSIPYTEQNTPAFRPFYYNIDILKQFGYNEPPRTWSELTTMAESITKQGKGQVYGFSLNGKDAAHIQVIELYETANDRYHDAHVTEGNLIYDTKTGKSAASNPALTEAVQLFQEMAAKKVYVPGWESVDGKTLFTQFASGKVAMYIGPFFYANEMMKLNPSLKLGMTTAPVPDTGRKGYKAVYGAADPYFGITSESKHPKEAFKVIEFFSTKEFQQGWSKTTNLPAVLWRDYDIHPMTKKLLDLAYEDLRIAPNPGNRHPDGEKLLSSIMAGVPKPDVKELINLSIISNKDYGKLAKEFDALVDQVIEKQLAEHKGKGSSVSRDIFIAPADWNPMENYLK
ncbi:extracellular solute-binding protein [Paenibacillus sp. YYML68]|uniref:extracellular solute-binding protein n=1 Tax=Paenibacillus sp. YYML68 TaxID=2909250 RepID=UPI002492392D|nr:sugar ABC transporter substrate-binding protein [Paenibacillus sp. YYML68]